MIKGQKSVRGGIEDMLHPCTDMYITQGSNGGYSHKGIMANDVRGIQPGVRYPYYAPCTVKCMAIYPSSGQAMWQSTGNVRCPNGYVGKVTFMTAHDDSFDAKVGMVVPQGNQLGNMGTKGNATGVHLHFQTAQTSSTKWYKNNYGIYRFDNEVDIDDVCFVDNTNILNGMGGSWKKTSDIPVVEPKPQGADQILYAGSKVKFDGIFKVDIIKSPVSSNLFGCCALTGCSLNDYKNEKVKSYHWLPGQPFIECDKNGNETKDQMLQGGVSYVKNNNIYRVENIDIPTQSVELIMNGRSVWVFSKYLYEVSDK